MQDRKKFDLDKTWIGWLYTRGYTIKAMVDLARFASSLSPIQKLVSVTSIAVSPIAQYSGNAKLIEWSGYFTSATSCISDPLAFCCIFGANAFSDAYLEQLWDSLTDEQQNDGYYHEGFALLHLAKMECARIAGKYASNKINEILHEPKSQVNHSGNSDSNNKKSLTDKQIDKLIDDEMSPKRKGRLHPKPHDSNGMEISRDQARELLKSGKKVTFHDRKDKPAVRIGSLKVGRHHIEHEKTINLPVDDVLARQAEANHLAAENQAAIQRDIDKSTQRAREVWAAECETQAQAQRQRSASRHEERRNRSPSREREPEADLPQARELQIEIQQEREQRVAAPQAIAPQLAIQQERAPIMCQTDRQAQIVFQIPVAVNQGVSTLGIFGSGGRKQEMTLGDTLNIALRVYQQGGSKKDQLIAQNANGRSRK